MVAVFLSKYRLEHASKRGPSDAASAPWMAKALHSMQAAGAGNLRAVRVAGSGI